MKKYSRVLISVIATSVLIFHAWAVFAGLMVDTTFDSGGVGLDSAPTDMIEQPDGKIIVAGYFNNFNGVSASRILRLNADGTRDMWFNVIGTFNGTISAMELQQDGKVVVGGSFTSFSGVTTNHLIRFNSDGTRDNTFQIGSGLPNSSDTVSVIKQLTGWKLLIWWIFSSYSGFNAKGIIRLNEDGTRDTSFNITNSQFSGETIYEFEVATLIEQDDGKIIAGGQFMYFSWVNANRIIRLNEDATIDNTFNIGSGFNNDVYHMVEQSDGKIIAIGSFTAYNGNSANRIARLNADGTFDTSFTIWEWFNNVPLSVSIQSWGSILLGGVFTSYSGVEVNRFARLDSNGVLDASFIGGSGFDSDVNTHMSHSDGGILVGGFFEYFNGMPVSDPYMTRLIESIWDNSPAPQWGWKVYRAPVDYCPEGDTSMTQYDGLCAWLSLMQWGVAVETTWTVAAATWTIIESGDATEQTDATTDSSSEGSSSSEMVVQPQQLNCMEWEMNDAYTFAYGHSITTMSDCIKANMTWVLLRRDAAKMISNYAINALGKKPDDSRKCIFTDMANSDPEYEVYAKLACQLGVMGINNVTNEINTNFNPDESVTKAQFATILSRLLYGPLYNGDDENWYVKHVDKLHELWVIKMKTDLFSPLPRWWAMLMLMRL